MTMGGEKHTPGPWAVTGISQDTGNISVGQRDLRIVIADVTNAASFGDMLAGAMARGGGSFRQSDASTQFANARLIAAAPEMFDALKLAQSALAMMIEPNSIEKTTLPVAFAQATEAEAAARAALSKAGGAS